MEAYILKNKRRKKYMFNSIISGSINAITFITCIGVSLALGLIISLVHMKTTAYSKNFASRTAMTLFTAILLSAECWGGSA